MSFFVNAKRINKALTSRNLVAVLAVIVSSWLGGCEEQGARAPARPPVAIEHGDECHVCGMIITQYPGPKGEAYVLDHPKALKFCSTRDLFAFLLQPESAAIVREVYVHDMAMASWQQPADEHLIDARAAWYVAGHELKGAMGPTLASFRRQEDAQAFMEQHGGYVLRFADIDLKIITELGDNLEDGQAPR